MPGRDESEKEKVTVSFELPIHDGPAVQIVSVLAQACAHFRRIGMERRKLAAALEFVWTFYADEGRTPGGDHE